MGPALVVDRRVPRPRGSQSELSPATKLALRRLGGSIRKLREAKGWTLGQLEEETGVDSAYLGRVENGAENLTFRSLHRIAEGLSVSIVLAPDAPRPGRK
jgi:hypothetical protein